jgi:hypothetical protein
LSLLSVLTIRRSPKGDAMLTVNDRRTVEAAKYFQGEVLDIMPDIPRSELSDMVGEYIYYQQADVGKDKVREVVRETCMKK